MKVNLIIIPIILFTFINGSRQQNNNITYLLLLVITAILLSQPSVRAQDKKWEPDREILRSRPYPQWFKNARLGIFIHWGVYSVPAYGGPESQAEWYHRDLQTEQETGTIKRL